MIRAVFWCGVAVAAITASVGWGSVDRSFTYFRDNAYEREAALQQCLSGQVKGLICQNAARAARAVADREGLLGLYSPTTTAVATIR
ncbi:MAG: hypothetical protein Q8N10_00845 [Phenylobacterium sp.]|uniref:hypothetical protein n=1 Tax=Phenylobacterium sp. TaxID=1871053 RepID=UPI002724F14B|nr:hypothetical protein [Phenylobacterium sp.]MDO8913673.1 hypothetical protein [Phenylobacterium sp.]MDP3099027.1 hypothetical protein [Phenylobacterium sp.]